MKSDELFALLRRRGFLWPSAEIYGGVQGLYDYGPLGTALKRRVEDAWAAWFLGLSDDYYRIEPTEILPEASVRASGHLENFTDPEVECPKCHSAFRAETLLEEVRPQGIDGLSPAEIGQLLLQHKIRCPTCGYAELSIPRPFNMMFGLEFGATGKERAYLRPETAQGSYLSFPRMWDVGRRAIPLGVAVVGKAYRNEIAPRQVLFRMRAFTQAELQIFFDPAHPPTIAGIEPDEELPVLRVVRRESGESEPEKTTVGELAGDPELPRFFVDHMAHTMRFFRDVLGHTADSIRFLEKSASERAFYNRIQFDVEVRLESLGGYKELAAVHYRGDYDLSRHGKASGKDLAIRPPEGEKLLPHVLELTFGVDRNLWALADSGLGVVGDRTVWRLTPCLAPVPLAVFPLLKKEHGALAREVVTFLRSHGLPVDYDDAGGIGRRYARMDEVGTPFCATVDGESLGSASLDNATVTLRERDSRSQERMEVGALPLRIGMAVRFPVPKAVADAG